MASGVIDCVGRLIEVGCVVVNCMWMLSGSIELHGGRIELHGGSIELHGGRPRSRRLLRVDCANHTIRRVSRGKGTVNVWLRIIRCPSLYSPMGFAYNFEFTARQAANMDAPTAASPHSAADIGCKLSGCNFAGYLALE